MMGGREVYERLRKMMRRLKQGGIEADASSESVKHQCLTLSATMRGFFLGVEVRRGSIKLRPSTGEST